MAHPAVCQRADEFIAQLLAAPRTMIHGEFYPGNILYEKGRICPVDWESAAIAAGELDLAALTEGWQPASCHGMRAGIHTITLVERLAHGISAHVSGGALLLGVSMARRQARAVSSPSEVRRDARANVGGSATLAI